MAEEKEAGKSREAGNESGKNKSIQTEEGATDILEAQPCPMCREKTLVLMENEREIPYFGKVYIFSMDCSSCKYHKADIESAEERDPAKYEIEISGEADMKIRVVKSSEATVKIPHVCTIEPGPASNGYVTNIEGILNRVKKIIEGSKEGGGEGEEGSGDDDKAVRKKAKNLLKKLQRAMWGQDRLRIIVEDPTGNSAIISDKAIITKMKKKQS